MAKVVNTRVCEHPDCIMSYGAEVDNADWKSGYILASEGQKKNICLKRSGDVDTSDTINYSYFEKGISSYWQCTREKGHTGIHVACNYEAHNKASWFDWE